MPGWPISGLSRFTRSTTGTAVLRAQLPHGSRSLRKQRAALLQHVGQISQERDGYHDILEKTQKRSLAVTPWMEWFLDCLGRAIDGAQTSLGAVLATGRFWSAIAGTAINDRQRLVLNRFLDGFEGKLTTSKYAKLAECSHDTALRDILLLVGHGILIRNAEGGRSTSYALANMGAVKP
jgi:Fic family protein